VGGGSDVPCYHPLSAYRNLKTGLISFNKEKAGDASSLDLPCGRCIGCRLERSRQWAARIMHEAKASDHCSFVTLTYSPDNLPQSGSLTYDHFQRFMKRLRKKYGPVRFYMCGEYGDELQRPHYHACLFGVNFHQDRKVWKTSNGFTLYRSPSLEILWPYGFSSIGDLTFETAAYTARYVMKKVTGSQAEPHYQRIDANTGEVINLTPEFNKMSLRPGIGKQFFDDYKTDIYPHDYMIVNGKKSKPPRYYDKQLKKLDEMLMDDVKTEREFQASKLRADNTIDRLAVREKVASAALNQLKRNKV